MNDILISIHSEWVAKILNLEKRLEVRLSAPKETYINNPDGSVSLRTVYIYCTKSNNSKLINCFGRYGVLPKSHADYETWRALNGKVVAKFSLEYCVQLPILHDYNKHCAETVQAEKEALEAACLTREQVDTYRKGGMAWGWSIKDLQAFDKPMLLEEFDTACNPYKCPRGGGGINCVKPCTANKVIRPPQSWQFVGVGQ